MSNLKETVRLLRSARGEDDARGRSTPEAAVEEVEFELVSTTMLRAMLDSGSAEHQQRLRDAAAGKQGVLAKNLGSGTFEIIDDDDLKTGLAEGGAAEADVKPLLARADTDDEELSLVSTQALRRMLGQAEEKPEEKEKTKPKLPGGGFDPYNSA